MATGDPLDKYTCDGCHITTEVDRTECKRCKANIPSDASTSSTLPSRIDGPPKQKGTLIEMVKCSVQSVSSILSFKSICVLAL